MANFTLVLVVCVDCKVLFFEKPEICPVCHPAGKNLIAEGGQLREAGKKFTELHIETPRVEEREIVPVNHGYIVAPAKF